MSTLLKKLIPQNIAGILGVIQLMIPLVRELLMVILRIIAVIKPGENSMESVIVKVKDTLDSIEEGFERVKNIFL